MLLYLIIILVSLILYKTINKNSDYWKKRNVRQVDGVILKYLMENSSLAEFHQKIYKHYSNEPYVGLIVGSTPVLLLRDPENIQAVLTDDFQSFYSRGFRTSPRGILAKSLLLIEDYGHWRIIRQKMSTVFTTAKLKAIFGLLEESAKEFTMDVCNVPDPVFSLYKYTTSSLTGTCFGEEEQYDSKLQKNLVEMTWYSTLPTFRLNFKFFMAFSIPKLMFWLNISLLGECDNFFVDAVKKVLKRRRESCTKRNDFIDVCMGLQDAGTLTDSNTGRKLEVSDDWLAAQAFFFYLAGVDTSATAMHFTLVELAHNPELLKRAQEEIDKVFDKCHGRLTFEAIENNLQFLNNVLTESLRKYPPIGIIQRRCMKETILPVGNLKVEKDVLVIVPVYSIQRDSDYYPEPDKFDPERFASGDLKHKTIFLAYGKGNRSCIGIRYARMQVKVGLAWLLHRYSLLPRCEPPKTFEQSFFGLRATKNIYYELVPRQY